MTLELIEKIENYILGKLSEDDKNKFEENLKTDKNLFVAYSEYKQLISTIKHSYNKEHLIKNLQSINKKYNSPIQKVRLYLNKQSHNVLFFTNKNRAILSVSALLVVLVVSVVYFVNVLFSHTSQLTELKRNLSNSINKLEHKINLTDDIRMNEINKSDGSVGTGFLIDNDGYLVTNSHLVQNAKNIFAENLKGNLFNVVVVYVDQKLDLAILKVTDSNFVMKENIPYQLSGRTVDLGEPLFTLGFPKEEIVYGEGYLSSKNGFNSDSSALQINISLNPGNSGGPIFDLNGNIIGIVRNKQKEVDGVSFAIKGRYILQSIKNFKQHDTLSEFKNFIIKNSSSVPTNKILQIKQYQPFIYLIRSYS